MPAGLDQQAARAYLYPPDRVVTCFLRLWGSVAHARYAPSSSGAFHGKDTSRTTHPTFPMAC
ncbi:MAG: hypothetical protein KTR25_02035 [Myxococcales bacterium]|nr:hypothetical protein [Myxococcales bacterium]